jgi:UDP-glucose 4-epimerase
MSKTILVTGGAGYIGSQTNLALLEKGYKTVIFDNLVYGYQDFVPSESIFYRGDLSNSKEINQVFKEIKIDGVIHFAAYAYVGESVENPRKYYENNVVGSLNLLNAMLDNKINNLVFSSTCATYGIPDKVPISENEKQKPINPYGYTKLVVENIMKDYSHAFGLNSIALRYFNACGGDPDGRVGESHNPETHLIPLILEVANGKRDKIKIFGQDYNTPDGTCVRDYIHTMDLASAHILALEKLMKLELDEKYFDYFNLGTGKGFSVKEIIASVEKITGKTINKEVVARRSGDPDVLVADNTKAKEILGWQTQYSDIDNVIATAWEWEKQKKS